MCRKDAEGGEDMRAQQWSEFFSTCLSDIRSQLSWPWNTWQWTLHDHCSCRKQTFVERNFFFHWNIFVSFFFSLSDFDSFLICPCHALKSLMQWGRHREESMVIYHSIFFCLRLLPSGPHLLSIELRHYYRSPGMRFLYFLTSDTNGYFSTLSCLDILIQYVIEKELIKAHT